jgi:hypothetical protein
MYKKITTTQLFVKKLKGLIRTYRQQRLPNILSDHCRTLEVKSEDVLLITNVFIFI